MSAASASGCGPGPGPNTGPASGVSNPRKFSEKIALHTQRQAEETAAFQEVMMDITSTRVSSGGNRGRAGGKTGLPGYPLESSLASSGLSKELANQSAQVFCRTVG